LADAELFRYIWSDEIDPREAFEATTCDTEEYMCLFDEDGWLDEQMLRELDGPVDGHVLVVDRVRVAPAWRGRLLGPLLAAGAIIDLGVGCAVAAAYPSPFELERDDPGRPEQQKRLERLWQRFGFTPWRNGVFVLAIESNTLGNTFEWLRANAANP
jgi:GNAT superfamily N-acetyltransferase